MIEGALTQERAVQFAFCQFVADHVAQAALWCVMPRDKSGEKSYTRIKRVEFYGGTYTYSNGERDGSKEDSFGLSVHTKTSLLGEGATLERYVGSPLDITDKSNEISVILDDPNANDEANQLRSAVRLVGYLKELEDAGYLVPAWQRQYEF
jgi:hypothetical protein